MSFFQTKFLGMVEVEVEVRELIGVDPSLEGCLNFEMIHC